MDFVARPLVRRRLRESPTVHGPTQMWDNAPWANGSPGLQSLWDDCNFFGGRWGDDESHIYIYHDPRVVAASCCWQLKKKLTKYMFAVKKNKLKKKFKNYGCCRPRVTMTMMLPSASDDDDEAAGSTPYDGDIESGDLEGIDDDCDLL